MTVYLDVSREVLKSRLVSRWRDHGLNKSDAEARAEGNDIKNVELVQLHSVEADYSVSSGED